MSKSQSIFHNGPYRMVASETSQGNTRCSIGTATFTSLPCKAGCIASNFRSYEFTSIFKVKIVWTFTRKHNVPLGSMMEKCTAVKYNSILIEPLSTLKRNHIQHTSSVFFLSDFSLKSDKKKFERKFNNILDEIIG
jgi:hypothetical protein